MLTANWLRTPVQRVKQLALPPRMKEGLMNWRKEEIPPLRHGMDTRTGAASLGTMGLSTTEDSSFLADGLHETNSRLH